MPKTIATSESVESMRWRLNESSTSCGGDPEAEDMDVRGLMFGEESELGLRREEKWKPKLMLKRSLGRLFFFCPAFSNVNVVFAHVCAGLGGRGGSCRLETCVAIVPGCPDACSRSSSVLGLRPTGMFRGGSVLCC
jgi:hypothetical protein